LWAIYNAGAQHFEAFRGLLGSGKVGEDAYVAGWLQALVPPDLRAPGFVDCVVFGLQRMLPILIVSYGVGLGIEMLFSVIRKEEVSEGFLVSGMLIALIVPASIPHWQLACGVAFAVVLGKEVFGGTGMNVFNPAMLCRAFLFFAFPAQMSGDAVWVAGNNSQHLLDGYSAPTALAIVKPNTVVDASAQLLQTYSHADLFFGNVPGSAGEMSKLCVLLGAFWLLFTGVASWRTMAGGMIGLLAAAFLMQVSLPAGYGGPIGLHPWEHLLVGGFLFGIVFMATDPVSSPETDRGKWIYGALIGLFTVLVRAINPAYPEGTMLSILLMNAFAPTIDHFVVGRSMKRRLARQ
jgi:Na+-transporting NADH:ubiquinone oxidoreductase subunit B